jgi:predicted membrane-bound spermidine synthase
MTIAPATPGSRQKIHYLVAVSGLAALSWEVLWQIKSSLALGVSAWGTAITLAATMGGLSLGSLLMSRWLHRHPTAAPLRVYGVMEIIVGLAGLTLGTAFQAVENLDTVIYATNPATAPFLHLLSIVAILGIPTLCMGGTLPIFGQIARQFQTSIAVLYGLNTLGAASGALLVAFLLLPWLGVAHTGMVIAAINIALGLYVMRLPAPTITLEAAPDTAIATHATIPQFGTATTYAPTYAIVALTGFATLALEVAWFRSFTCAFRSTTGAFAVMLAAVLIALGIAARVTPTLKRLGYPLGGIIAWAGILIIAVTPVIERFDQLSSPADPTLLYLNWFFVTFVAICAPVTLLGVALPWLLDNQCNASRRIGRLYAVNTLAAIAGSLGAAWLLLPTIGFAHTAWLIGALVAFMGLAIAPSTRRIKLATISAAILMLAVIFDSGIGTVRIQGPRYAQQGPLRAVLGFYEGPDTTASVTEYASGARMLVLNGASASGQMASGHIAYDHYLTWMGRLPMVAHPQPKNAMVICFGTGQTANAVRQENPESLDIVDINKHVFQLAPLFTSNENVLGDPRTRAVVMDGRAFMRRTDKLYDVITLEPMPPTQAGVNALYSQEFYQRARSKLVPGGIIAQWLPLHGVAYPYSASIARTFQQTFPNAILWIDPISITDGILLGSTDANVDLTTAWPGLNRASPGRNLSGDEVRQAVALNRTELARYAAHGAIISDDNQLLAYGSAVAASFVGTIGSENLTILNAIKAATP